MITISAANQAAWAGKSLVDTEFPQREGLIVLKNSLAAVSVAGISDLKPNRITTIINRGTFNITLAANDAAAPVADRFGTEVVIAPGKKAAIFYNGLLGELVAAPGSGEPDADASAFMTATAIPNDATLFYEGTAQEIAGSAIWTAMDTFVKALKTASLWEKLVFLYPFVGGTADSHKWNLKDPRDLDAAKRIAWTGTVVHDAFGAASNLTGYGNTFTTGADLVTDDVHIAEYVRTQINANTYYDAGVRDLTVASTTVAMRHANGAGGFIIGLLANAASFGVSGIGLTLGSRTSNAEASFYKNGVVITTQPHIGLAASNITRPIYLMCWNDNGTPLLFNTRPVTMFSVGRGLSVGENAAYYAAVQAFQTALIRNV